MQENPKRIHPVLLLLCILLSLALCPVVTSSSNKGIIRQESDTIIASAKSSDETVPVVEVAVETPEPTVAVEAKPTASPTPEPTAEPTEAPKEEENGISPEAYQGRWVSSGIHWMFMVDSVPFTGLLTDTDHHRYYLNEDGIMVTGLYQIGDAVYYFDLDGIMQTGEQIINGDSYTFSPEGPCIAFPGQKDSSNESKTSGKKKKANKDNAQKENESAEADEAQDPAQTEQAEEQPKEEISENVQTAADSETAAEGSEPEEQIEEVKYLALTFDDGPSSFTKDLVDCLKENNAHATFFLVGTEAENFTAEISMIEEAGCEIGNHSYNHEDLTSLSADGILETLNKTNAIISSAVGHEATLVRPPYGSINDSVSATIPLPMILWSVDTLDWETDDVKGLTREILQSAGDGEIILMHDIYSTSVKAAIRAIPKLIKRGYKLVTVSELAQIKGIELHTGVAYGAMHGD